MMVVIAIRAVTMTAVVMVTMVMVTMILVAVIMSVLMIRRRWRYALFVYFAGCPIAHRFAFFFADFFGVFPPVFVPFGASALPERIAPWRSH